MNCPKCENVMELVSFNGIEVDRCSGCRGLWFDYREQDELKKLRGAEIIDVGDEFIGAKYDQIHDVDCPRCHTPLHNVSHNVSNDILGDTPDSSAFEISFERCASCKGSFFDAGEFTDYVAEEIFDEFETIMSELGTLESGQNLVDG